MLELWQEKLENVNVQEPHLTPNRVLNAETNEKPFLDCIFDTNNLSAHIIAFTQPPASEINKQNLEMEEGQEDQEDQEGQEGQGEEQEEQEDVSMNERSMTCYQEDERGTSFSC